MPLSAALLALMALPLASGSVRTGRAGSLIAAILVYLIYFNLLNVLQGWISEGRVGFANGFLLVHGGAALILLALLMKGNGWLQRLWQGFTQRGASA